MGISLVITSPELLGHCRPRLVVGSRYEFFCVQEGIEKAASLAAAGHPELLYALNMIRDFLRTANFGPPGAQPEHPIEPAAKKNTNVAMTDLMSEEGDPAYSDLNEDCDYDGDNLP